MPFRDRLQLVEGHTLGNRRYAMKGFMGQIDEEQFDVLDQDGNKIGTGLYTDETDVKEPYRRHHHVVQRDASGKSIVDQWW